jgi:dynein heavy chain
MFAGLSHAGVWGCFDEFNRISIEVLSVVAQQVNIILEAIRNKVAKTVFGELTIIVEKSTGLFITMNPGYAGRSALPDNLSSLFRPVAMMKADIVAIIKISMMSTGFREADELSKKIGAMYELMERQLSKQGHYEFGMRSIKSVLRALGRVKRENRDMKEVSVAIKSLRDMNLPKFISDDVILFDNLFMDLFPDCEEPENDNDELQLAVEEALMNKGLYLNENMIVKVMQLYGSKIVRHGNMLVGKTMSGKSTVWKILKDAMDILHKEDIKKGMTEGQIRYKKV